MLAMRNRPQKLSRLRLPEETWVLELEQLLWSPNHAFSISFIFSPSVTFNIAQETSDTKGEPFGKTWETLKKEKKKKGKKKNYMKNYNPAQTHTHERERESELTKPNPSFLYMDWIMVYLEQYCDSKTFIKGTSSKAAAIPPFALPFDKSSSHSSVDLYVLSLVGSKFISSRSSKT